MYVASDLHLASKRRMPYVGVTGFMTVNEIQESINMFNDARSDVTSHDFMAGILLSHHVLETGNHPDKGTRYPSRNTIPALLDAANKNGVFRVLHYNTKNPWVHDDVDAIVDAFGLTFDGIQLNTSILPSKEEIARIRDSHQKLRIILQANSAVMRDHSMIAIADTIANHDIDYVLVDPSGGRGKDIDVQSSSSMYRMIEERTKFTIGFAGGFPGENIEGKTREYVKSLKTTNFCIDAEGKLRDASTDAMDLKRVDAYLHGFFRGIRG
jgi:hypothetical protein